MINKKWAESLSLKDRLKVQRFMLLLYGLEINDGKN